VNEFGLAIEYHDGVYENVVVPLVDGTSLIEWLAIFDVLEGLEHDDEDPAFSGVRKEDLDAKPFRPGRAQLVLGCSCGIASCGPLVARIVNAGDTIVWDQFRRPHKGGREYVGFGPYIFDLRQYEKALEKLVELG